jgi:hypothetical protein
MKDLTKEDIEGIIMDIMVNDGPDGHTDGSELITEFIMCLMAGKKDEWLNRYYSKRDKRYFKKEL